MLTAVTRRLVDLRTVPACNDLRGFYWTDYVFNVTGSKETVHRRLLRSLRQHCVISTVNISR